MICRTMVVVDVQYSLNSDTPRTGYIIISKIILVKVIIKIITFNKYLLIRRALHSKGRASCGGLIHDSPSYSNVIMAQAQALIPPQPRAKALRACLLCSLIQTPADFRRNGCPNCDEILQVRTSRVQCPHMLMFMCSIDERCRR
jgi:hypothetical protein